MGKLKDKASRHTETFGTDIPLSDELNRARKADKIRAVLEQGGDIVDSNIRLLVIGCSYGHILKSLTPASGFGASPVYDKNTGDNQHNIVFIRADAENLPFLSHSFDVVICNHVYEHADSPECMISEIGRVLTDTGICYFAGPKKYDVVEPYYDLPFLSRLPDRMADRHVRSTGKGESFIEKPHSYPALKELPGGFPTTKYTGKVLKDPVKYAAEDILTPESLMRLFALALFSACAILYPASYSYGASY
jgi:SAM-dependent methyltransferase